ncbi:MAG TPA: polymer-forming cytoskeletal protein [Myxococcota bacterium]|jgi:cytoskeletal protein CcmA (bactofilin family)|nr:polymer-forming cytoskeletal protein [Myxococcota bacterium]
MATVVGDRIFINGNLQGDEDLTVHGRIKGTVNISKSLIVEPSGIVEAEVQVANAVVSGVVVGNITATDSVEILKGGRMVGDITAPRVILTDGALFRGGIDMGDVKADDSGLADARARAAASRRPGAPARVERPAPRPAAARPATRPSSPARPTPPRPAPPPAPRAAADVPSAPTGMGASAAGGGGPPAAPKPPSPPGGRRKKILLKRR